MSSYRILRSGESHSFPEAHAFVDGAEPRGKGLVLLGTGHDLSDVVLWQDASFVAVELGSECLAVHGGLESGPANGDGRLVGFARFRMGSGAPSPLVELVRQPWTRQAALDAARAAFEASGLVIAVCEDFHGRIVDRLLRPYLNAVLRRLDERLATADDLDTTLRMGLGYPEGPIALLRRTGLAEHFDVTQALYEALGQEPYAPARAARAAKLRAE